MNAPEQLQMFEPTGQEVLHLANKHATDAVKALALAQVWEVQGWHAVASRLRFHAEQKQELAAQMRMLAEFEALGGVA
jgi:hypothetical protein